jgi:hypothetical protein
VSEDLITNRQRAVAAFETIRSYASTRNELGSLTFRGGITGNQRQDQDRLIRLLAALRHHSDCVNGLGFDDATRTGRWQYDRERTRLRGFVNPYQVAAARRAIHVHEQENRTPALYGGGFWPPDTLRDLRRYANRKHVSFETAMGSLTAGLITNLLHYAHRYGLDFDEALAVSGTAYTEQRLREEGPFQAGQDTGRDASLVSLATRPFRPIATRQGVVTSGSDAEWLIVRSAARVRDTERRGHAVSDLTEDIDDKLALSAALAAACNLSISEVLDRLEPRISARAEKMQRAVEAAAQMGRAHGLAGVQPYWPLDADGDDSGLMAAFGETEPTTHANAGYRLTLAGAYTDAYKLASATSGPSTVMPTEQTGRDFPHRPVGPVPPGDAATAADQAGHAARAQPRRSRRGFR